MHSTRLPLICASLALMCLVPAAAKPEAAPSASAAPCIANLMQLDSAKEQWSMDNKKRRGASVSMKELVGADKYLRKEPRCPAGGKYTLGKIGEQPRCSLKGHALPASPHKTPAG
jgi:hypothetical protein